MNNYIRLIKKTIRYWKFYILAFISMLGYALFSAANVPLFIPLMDDVLNRAPQAVYEILEFDEFKIELNKAVDQIFQNTEISFLSISDIKENVYPAIQEIFLKTDPMLLLMSIIVLLFVLTLLKLLFFILSRISTILIEGRTTKNLKDEIFSKYLNFPFAFFDRHKVGDAMVRISSDVTVVTQKMLAVALDVIRDLTLMVLYLVSAILINPMLFLLIIIVLPPLIGITSFIANKIKKYTKRLQEQLAIIFNKVEEVFRGLKIVRAYRKEGHEEKRFQEITQKEFRMWLKRTWYSTLNTPLSELSGIAIAVTVLWFGGRDILDPDSSFSFGSFMAFLTAILLALQPLKASLKNWMEIKKAMAHLDRIFEVLDTKVEVREPEAPIAFSGFKDKIELKNVFFAYDKSRSEWTLKDISLSIKKGEKVAFVGATGSGKTTLVNLLPRFYNIQEGEILMDGNSISRISTENLRSLFGYVTQDSFLFNDTIAENVGYSLEEMDAKKVVKACEIANATEFIEKLPDGLNTVISNYGANFSGGQKQRLSIARAIVNDPEILIFDEATSALDSEAEDKVQKAISNATQNKTLVVIAHRLSTILNSDKIVVIKEGQVNGIGHHEELLKTNEEYKKLYEIQFRNEGSRQ